MTRANLRPVDVPAKLLSSLESAINADFPTRRITATDRGPEEYAQPHIRADTERLINGDRDRLKIDRGAEELRMEQLEEEIRTSPLDLLRRKLLSLVYGEMIELCEGIMKEAGDKPITNADELAKLVHRSASSRK